MHKPLFFVGILLVMALPTSAQQPKLADWTTLIDAGKCAEAKKLCSGFASSSEPNQKVESQKCLANVALCGNEVIELQGDDAGGGSLSGGYNPEAIDEALSHLNAALKLAPQDLSIHQGRLHILEISGRFSAMSKALDESCDLYKGVDAQTAWLAYASELADLRQYQAGLDFMLVLDKHYPNQPDILGNIGAFLNLLKRDSEAIPYLQKATALAPKIQSTHGTLDEPTTMQTKSI